MKAQGGYYSVCSFALLPFQFLSHIKAVGTFRILPIAISILYRKGKKRDLMQHHEEIVEYFNTKGVSVIFLFRRNLLRRMISILANSYDQSAKLLNGTHKSHVHSSHEAKIIARYKPTIDAKLLIPSLKQVDDMVIKALEYFKSTRHIIMYYEDIVKNRTIVNDVQDFLRVPQMDLRSRQVKIHRGSLHEQVENWDIVQKALHGTQYESFLHDNYKL